MRISLLCTVLSLGGVWSKCRLNQISSCPNYMYNTNLITAMIPFPESTSLEALVQSCSKIQAYFRCLLGPDIVGTCDGAIKGTYIAMSKAAGVACLRNKTEYLDGKNCWQSPKLKQTMNLCYAESLFVNQTCKTMAGLKSCTVERMLKLQHCGSKEQQLLDKIIGTFYESVGLYLSLPCEPLETTTKTPVPTTTTATTTTTTTATTDTTESSASPTPPISTIAAIQPTTTAKEPVSTAFQDAKSTANSEDNFDVSTNDVTPQMTSEACNAKKRNCNAPQTKASTHNAGSAMFCLKTILAIVCFLAVLENMI